MRLGVSVRIGRRNGSDSSVRNNDDRRDDLIYIPYLGANVILDDYAGIKLGTHNEGEAILDCS